MYNNGTKSRMRNLKQYKDMDNDEFEDLIARKEMKAFPDDALEKRIQNKLVEFSNDYEISDLKINDKLILRNLIQALLQLEDLEQASNQIRMTGVAQETIALLREINLMRTNLTKDVSLMQNDLNITRKLRKGDKEANTILFIEDLKRKANQFYKEKMQFIFCPKCNTLLGTVWTLYPDEKKNRIKLFCNRKIDDGLNCDGEVTISTKELLELGGTNKADIPETIK